MKFKGPIITLVAGAVLAGVIYTLNVDLQSDVARNNAARRIRRRPQRPMPLRLRPLRRPRPPLPPSSAPAKKGDGSGVAGKLASVTYAGAVDGGAASLGLVVNNGKAIAYVCDGKTAEAWVEGPMADGIVELTSAKGKLTGTYANNELKGTVSAGLKSWAFTIKVVKPPSGLYRSQAALRNKLDASWVVLPDGVQVGVQTVDGAQSAAPPFDINAKTATVGGTAITIEQTTAAGT